MRRLIVLAAAVLGVWACGAGTEGDAAAAADTLTRRQKDSIISEMPLPGSGGVRSALDAVDKANARTQAHDTIN